LEELNQNLQWPQGWFDPFAGSASTAIATDRDDVILHHEKDDLTYDRKAPGRKCSPLPPTGYRSSSHDDKYICAVFAANILFLFLPSPQPKGITPWNHPHYCSAGIVQGRQQCLYDPWPLSWAKARWSVRPRSEINAFHEEATSGRLFPPSSYPRALV